MFSTILVAIDGSDGSKKALETAVGLAGTCGADLLILTVYRHHSMVESSVAMVRPTDPENLDDVMREHGREVAEEAKRLAAEMGAAKVRAFVKMGPPARTIVKFAKEHGADLVVVGSRGHGDMEGFLLGSVSHKVTSLSDTPVLVV